MQRSGDEAKKCPGLDYLGQSKKEWPKHDAKKTGEKRLDAPDRIIGAEQAAGAAVPRTGSSRDKRRPGAPDRIILGWQPVHTRAGLDRPRRGGPLTGYSRPDVSAGSYASPHPHHA